MVLFVIAWIAFWFLPGLLAILANFFGIISNRAFPSVQLVIGLFTFVAAAIVALSA